MSAFSLQKLFHHKKRFSLCALLLSACVALSAENFRVRKVIPVALTEINDKLSVQSGINDALFITLPKDLTYVSGIELNFKIPEEIVTWRDSVAYMLYDNLSPEVSEKKLDYHGNRVHLATIPGNFSLTLYVPISKDFSIKDNPYSVKLPLYQNYADGIFLRFMMVMKGVPESLESSIFEITAKPVLKNKGALNLSIVLPPQSHSQTAQEPSDGKKYSVFIDDVPVQENDFKKKILSTGEHHLSVVSDSFRNELRTFRIEQAKSTSLSVNLRGIEPLLKIICPKDTKVFLDGEVVKTGSEPLIVTQGEHSVKFILGDYEVIKTVSAMNGRTYSVNLNVDATVSEEE